MKLSCLQQKLNKGLSLAGRLVGTKTTLPVLNNVLLKAQKGKLIITSTDLETAITAKIGAKVEKEGQITVPARVLSDFVAANKDKKINLTLKENILTLKSKHSQAHVRGIGAGEFPLIPKVKGKTTFNLESGELLEGSNKVGIASATDDARPNLCGVYFKIKGKELNLVATDSYRLAEKKIILKQKESSNEKDFIMPLKAVHETLRILGSTEPARVKIKVNENQVALVLPGAELTSRLVEGEFPSYEQIIPQRFETKTSLNSNEFGDLVKIASVFAREAANNVELNFEKKGEVAVNAASDQVGDNRSKLKSEVEGKSNKIAFNAKYVSDVLGVLGDQEIDLEMTGSLNPGVVRPKNDKNYLYVIMPLRMDE